MVYTPARACSSATRIMRANKAMQDSAARCGGMLFSTSSMEALVLVPLKRTVVMSATVDSGLVGGAAARRAAKKALVAGFMLASTELRSI